MTLIINSFVIDSFNLKCRFGEWNLQANETFPMLEIEVDDKDVVIHPEFKSLKNLKNNIAILRLKETVRLGPYPTITPICLPSKASFDLESR